jgi:hypothetical protein
MAVSKMVNAVTRHPLIKKPNHGFETGNRK